MSGQYFRKIWVVVVLIGLLVLYVTLDSRLVTGDDAYTSVGRSLEEFVEAYKLVNRGYFKNVKPGELSTAAIEGMLEELDPYTRFFDRKAYEQLTIETTGKFGGLGITISKRGGIVPVVLSVFESTPADTAGLIVGDRISKVEGIPTSGKTLQEVVDVLRGKPGAKVQITIDRPGRIEPFVKSIIRARVSVPSVQLLGEVEPGIGYISMSGRHGSRFSENSGSELENAIKKIKARDIRGLILDLRGNPGGLLEQAVAVADKFLEPNRLVVSTRGRVKSQNKDLRTREPAMLPKIPLVLLVDGNSASASEIVAGVIQDSDRGLIIGSQTFGKGSVQTVRAIGKNKALKLTTAVYYTPSGRSIHSVSKRNHRWKEIELTLEDSVRIPVYQILGLVGQAEKREDVLMKIGEQFGLETEQVEGLLDTRLGQLVGLGIRDEGNNPKGSDPGKVFKTAGGRVVYGGGGITPDLEVFPEKRPAIVIAMIRTGLFFNFAVEYAVNRSFPQEFELYSMEEGIVDSFRIFLDDSMRAGEFTFKTVLEIQLLELEKSLKETKISQEEENILELLRPRIRRDREAIFEKARSYIRQEIERQLANRVWGIKAYSLASIKGDKQYEAAIQILNNLDAYRMKMNLAIASENLDEKLD